MKQEKILNKVVLIAMFSALCCAGTFVQIRMPAGDFVHLGNFIMIVAALLLGGVAGGSVGSLGMGIYDLIFYSDKPSTIIRTFVLKFIVGFIVGFLFRFIMKKKKDPSVWLYVVGALFAAVFVLSSVYFGLGDRTDFKLSEGFSSTYKATIFGNVAKIKISIYIPVFAFLFTIASIMAAVFSHKLTTRQKAALFAVTIAIFVNIIGEFILRWLLEGLMINDKNFTTSFVTATSKIPGSIITGFISVVLSVLVYEPVYRAVKDNKMFKDFDIDDTSEVFDNEEVVEVESHE